MRTLGEDGSSSDKIKNEKGLTPVLPKYAVDSLPPVGLVSTAVVAASKGLDN
jgi:hypothetical protein